MTKKYRLIIETNTEKEDADSYTCYNRTEIDTLVKVDSVLTARDLLNRYNLLDEEIPIFIMYKPKNDSDYELLENLKFYYKDGVLYPSFDPVDVKILEFEEYGYSLNSVIHIIRFENGGIGSASEFLDICSQIYEEINKFVLENPLMYSVITYLGSKLGKAILKKAVEVFEKNLYDYSVFKEGLLFKREFSLDSFTKAFQLEDLKENYNYEEYWAFVNSLLTVYGFHYDVKLEKWCK